MKIKTLSRKHFYTPVLVVFLVGLVFLTFSVNVFAAGSSANGNSKFFPYYITSDSLDPVTIQNYIDDEYAWWGFVPFDFEYDRIIAWNYTENNTDYICFLGFDYDSYSFSSYPTDFDPLLNHITISINNCDIYYAFKDYGWSGQKSYGYWQNVQTSERFFEGGVSDFFYLKSPLFYPSENVPDFSPSTSNMIFTNSRITVPIPPQNSIIPPHETNDYNHGHGITNGNGNKPSLPSTPTINNYSWTTYTSPSIDTSSLEGLVQGLIDTVSSYFSWLASNLGGLFSNLISNISSFVSYLGDLLLYVSREIQDSIHDFLYFIYQNLVAFFEPLLNSITDSLFYIKQFVNAFYELGLDDDDIFSISTFLTALIVPDPSEMLTAFLSYDTVGVNNLVYSMVTVGKTTLSTLFNLTPVKSLYIPSTTWHGRAIGGFYVSFLWYEDYKVYGDSIISAFLIVGYLYWLFTSLSSVLRGSNTSEIPQSEPYHNPIGFNR